MHLLDGFINIFQNPLLVLIILLGVGAGMVIGALPGLTATMGVALFLPITFGMDAITGLLLLIGIYFGSIFGGSISAILLNTPGTPASAATAFDGNKLVKQGKAGHALTTAAVASGVGGLISVLMLAFISPQLAKIALDFSSPERFGLALFGISIIASISGDTPLKGIIAGIFGLLISTIGMDSITSYPRFTFGSVSLLNGLSFIPIMIGLFAVSESIVIFEEEIRNIHGKKAKNEKVEIPKLKEMLSLIPTMLRSGVIGTFIGIIPGAGADIASFVSYNVGQRLRKKDEVKFGEGSPKGVACSEAANNGVTGGAMVPLLTLGIPGDAVAAIMLGALIVQGIQPGPEIFTTNADIVFTLFSGMFIANIAMAVLGVVGIPLFSMILNVPKVVLAPVILMLSSVGAFAINNNFFDVYTMLLFGVLGYLMKKYKFPASPIVLAMILGPMAESEMRRSLVLSGGSYSIFITRPIALFFILIAIVSLALPYINNYRKSKKVNLE